VSQCVAVCCSVLQSFAVCCSVLQDVAVCRSVLQCVAVYCCFNEVARFLPEDCLFIRYFSKHRYFRACGVFCMLYTGGWIDGWARPVSHLIHQYTATHCIVCCSVLQCVAVYWLAQYLIYSTNKLNQQNQRHRTTYKTEVYLPSNLPYRRLQTYESQTIVACDFFRY